MDGQSLSHDVRYCLDKFDIPAKVFAYTSDSGGNVLTYKRSLDHVVDNSDILNLKQPIFGQ